MAKKSSAAKAAKSARIDTPVAAAPAAPVPAPVAAKAVKPLKAVKAVKAAKGARLAVGERGMPPNPPTAPSKELHVFANPAAGRDYLIQFQIPEFTCVCPLTGQPDFAHFTIEMVCDQRCIELKSLKMYMWSYRDEGSFHEKVTNTILDDLVAAADPRFVRITAKWYVRGGIYTNLVVEHRQKGWTPAPRIDLPAAGQGSATGML